MARTPKQRVSAKIFAQSVKIVQARAEIKDRQAKIRKLKQVRKKISRQSDQRKFVKRYLKRGKA